MISKTDEIYEIIKDDIIRMRLPVNDILNEKALAEKYHAGKTPVREALGRLVQEEYLKCIPRVGYFIRLISDEEFAKLNYLRFILEKGVVEWIIAHASDEDILSLKEHCKETNIAYNEFNSVNFSFHMAMAKLTGNQFLYEEIQRVFNRMVRRPSELMFEEIHESPHFYHIKLVDAMHDRNKEEALNLIRHECWRSNAPDSVI